MAEIVSMPKLGFDMAEGTLVRWVVQEGEPVAKGAVLAEIETDKATVEVESTYEGVVARHLVESGAIVPVNTPIAVIAAPGEAVDFKTLPGSEEKVQGTEEQRGKPEPSQQVLQPAETAAQPARELEPGIPGGVRASPLARRIAEELHINLDTVQGSGPGGRVTKKDVEAYLTAPTVSQPAAPPSAPARIPTPSPMPTQATAPTVAPMGRLRAAVGRRMTESKQQVPHFYVSHEYDMEALMKLRQEINALLPEAEKISVNDFIIKATALNLRQFPNLNASLVGNQIVQHSQVNVGVAVAVEGGLLTVVSRDTDIKPLRQIANELRPMLARARDGKVRPDDIEGSTFSVSNLGMFEVENFIAIINPPEAAILAVGAVKQVPVVKDGQIMPGLRMKATVSVDHRVSDGAEAARFMQALARFLEQPMRLMI